jgi:hypothetical protein
MRTVSVTIEGLEPGLLQKRFDEATTAGLLNEVKPTNKSKPTPEEEFEMGAYKLVDGTFVQPGEHIYQSMVKAAAGFQIQGGGKKTYKDSVKGSVLVSPEYIPHEIQDVKVDIRPVKIGMSRIIRHRPWIPQWKLNFEIQILDDNIPMEVINSILVKAGQTVGIGDYRPRFGRFMVTKFEEQ